MQILIGFMQFLAMLVLLVMVFVLLVLVLGPFDQNFFNELR